ncbi:MAG: peptide chain release factor N(5)-glutamine methyltransferase [Rhodospirillaceae bacterium]|jgi:release factor glutamine methyltransferase|nr:peptide chain release factor N(5)-glutamine methyltransferase [Rhodospirillaceae bacterium]MBT3494802.1 peptide chain release factor N(5)-glutamine methyltransferase [Rhodospirillaceae bacterium]MBT3779157.1 peptide chain release factor N(5)-glutamine methyltransferase [Rhodospirillaceae bacterium]MBT3976538.1 peptide chain release factor N(5)-glutamine methyltransferase [Rhodospirillaceae bacterium]MBT4171365.1 peptide chain release factor N(5)-glutamine methyltransferase [Rhodospirillaceae
MADDCEFPSALTLRQALAAAGRDLRDAGVEDAMLDAALLLAHAIGGDRLTLIREAERQLNEAETQAYTKLVAARAARQPVSRLLGRRAFWSLDLDIGPAVLDPRPDSETIVEAALAQLPDENAPYEIADFGTGSGCLLLALLVERPRAHGLGVDISPAAARQARENARALDLGDRGGFMVGDWGAGLAGGLGGCFDMIVSNPPYIASADIAGLAPEVRCHDPALALDGGADGLAAYRALVPDLRRLLRPGGRAVLEYGQGQTSDLEQIIKMADMAVQSCHADLAGVERCLVVSAPE